MRKATLNSDDAIFDGDFDRSVIADLINCPGGNSQPAVQVDAVGEYGAIFGEEGNMLFRGAERDDLVADAEMSGRRNAVAGLLRQEARLVVAPNEELRCCHKLTNK